MSFIQVPHGGATLLIFPIKICSAVQLEAKEALDARIEQKNRFVRNLLLFSFSKSFGIRDLFSFPDESLKKNSAIWFIFVPAFGLVSTESLKNETLQEKNNCSKR